MPTTIVVEDDPVVRNLIVHVLTRQGFVVYEADSPTEALTICNALRDESLDLLIAGESLTAAGGRPLALRVLEHCPNVAVLHISRGPYGEMSEAGEILPGSSFLQKPFTAGQLVNTVRDILDPRTQ